MRRLQAVTSRCNAVLVPVAGHAHQSMRYHAPNRTVDALASSCADTLRTLDLNGCSGVARRSHEELRAVLPRLQCFVVHS